MTNQVIAIGIILLFVIGATVVGMIPGMRQKMTLEQWAIGGRNFGRLLNWFILAGEIYTAFAFLGGSGWAYAGAARPSISWDIVLWPMWLATMFCRRWPRWAAATD